MWCICTGLYLCCCFLFSHAGGILTTFISLLTKCLPIGALACSAACTTVACASTTGAAHRAKFHVSWMPSTASATPVTSPSAFWPASSLRWLGFAFSKSVVMLWTNTTSMRVQWDLSWSAFAALHATCARLRQNLPFAARGPEVRAARSSLALCPTKASNFESNGLIAMKRKKKIDFFWF